MTLTPASLRLDFRSSSSSSTSSGGRRNCGPTSKACGNACIPRERNCRIEGGNKEQAQPKRRSLLGKAGRAVRSVAEYAGPDVVAHLLVSGGGLALHHGLKNRRKSYAYRQFSRNTRKMMNQARYGRRKFSNTDFRGTIRDSDMQFLHSQYIDPARPRRDTEDGKKYTKTVTNPKTGRKNKVRYGAKGYSIAPGTSKGDRYCARSFGDMKSHGKDCSGPDRNTPLCLSRAKWKCSGKTSRRDEGLTPGKFSA